MQMATKVEWTQRPYETSGGMVKKRKMEIQPKRRLSLFNGFPDEIVLIILSFGTMQDIRGTRVWQTAIVQHCTVTTNKTKAAENDNLDNLKWIHNCIGDTEFSIDYLILNCPSK